MSGKFDNKIKFKISASDSLAANLGVLILRL